MAAARVLLRHSRLSPSSPSPAVALLPVRSVKTKASGDHRSHPPPPPHDFLPPCEFLGSWKDPPRDPREAEARLGRLRRGFARQLKQLRREYTYEMELLRQEEQRRDDARREAARLANEERKAVKAAAAQTRAAERKVFEDNFRQALLKERVQKLESWRAKEELREKNQNEKKELLRKQSSMWISEENLEKRILEAIVDTTPL